MKKIPGLIALFILFLCSSGCAKTNLKESVTTEQIQQWAAQTLTSQANGSGIPISPLNTPSASPLLKPSVTDVPAEITKPTALQPIVIRTVAPTYVQPVAQVCDRLRFVDDVTIPDNTVLQPNMTFRKTWRIQNSGSCTWGQGYALVFDSGDLLSAPYSVPLPKSVAPNETIDLSVDMRAPIMNGVYTSTWKMQNPYGVKFGTASQNDNGIWAKITVNAGQGAINPTQSAPGPIGNICPIVLQSPAANSIQRVGVPFNMNVQIRNTTNVNWTRQSVDLAFIEGVNLLGDPTQTRFDLPYDIPLGAALTFASTGIAPVSPGSYTMRMGIVSGYEVLCTFDISILIGY